MPGMESTPSTDLAVVHIPTRLELSDHEIELVKSTVLAGQSFTDAEFAVYIRAAEHLGLDPLMKQVYGIKRNGKLSIQVGIDGFRLVAARTGAYVGNDRPEYGPLIREGKGQHAQDVPEWAQVTVRKMVAGVAREFVGLAYWAEFYPGDGPVGQMWRKMPYKMLGKCAEAEALRKAFPYELAGTYTPDEMTQSGQDDPLRGYRDELISRARALPAGHADQLRAWRHAQGIDPRTSEVEDLRRFDDELSRHEDAAQAEADADADIVDAEIVDDRSPGDDAGDGGGVGDAPAAETSPPPRSERAARYVVDRGDRRSLRAAVKTGPHPNARFDTTPLDLAHRAGLDRNEP